MNDLIIDLEQQVASLDLCMQLAKLGLPTETLHSWRRQRSRFHDEHWQKWDQWRLSRSSPEVVGLDQSRAIYADDVYTDFETEIYPAYTLAELMVLSQRYKERVGVLLQHGFQRPRVQALRTEGGTGSWTAEADTFANGVARVITLMLTEPGITWEVDNGK